MENINTLSWEIIYQVLKPADVIVGGSLFKTFAQKQIWKVVNHNATYS